MNIQVPWKLGIFLNELGDYQLFKKDFYEFFSDICAVY